MEKKTYHKKATGAALNTVKKHSKDHDLKLYGSCFWSVESCFRVLSCGKQFMLTCGSSEQPFCPTSVDFSRSQGSKLSIY